MNPIKNRPLPVKKVVKQVFDCPVCGKHQFSVGHVLDKDRDFMRWNCDVCGSAIRFRIEAGQVIFEQADPEWKRIPCAVELACGDYLFILKTQCLERETPEERDEGHRYLFNEHSCPTNFADEINAIVHPGTGDTDPHGALAYRRTILLTPEDLNQHGDLSQEFLARLCIPDEEEADQTDG